MLSTDVETTAESLDRFAAGDGDGWRELFALWQPIEQPFMDAFTTPFPPLHAAARLGAALGPRGVVRLARMALMPVRRLADEHFRGAGGALLLAGNAPHADLTPESAGGGVFGWILCSLGQHHGFPVPEGGTGRLTEAMVRRLRAHGHSSSPASTRPRTPRERRPAATLHGRTRACPSAHVPTHATSWRSAGTRRSSSASPNARGPLCG